MMNPAIPRRLRRAAVLPLALLLGAAACEPQAEVNEAGELAEVEPTPGEAGIELSEIWPFEQPDVGETVLANVYVAGSIPNVGFFGRTENNRVFFVLDSTSVMPNQLVRVVGQVQPAVQATFEEWERGIFTAGVEAEWEVDRTFYVDASQVAPM